MKGPRVMSASSSLVRVIVPTEGRDGIEEDCYIEFRRCDRLHAWEVHISDDLIRQAPEAVHAVLGLALMELKSLVRR